MDTEVLVVGAGPVGLMTAVELRRRGVPVMVVERRDEIAPWAKAIGVQARTLEIFDAVGIVRPALDASIAMRGQIIYMNGQQIQQMDLTLPDQIPYRFIALPQYETERVLGEHLSELGGHVRRGVEVLGFTQDDYGVTAQIEQGGHERQVRARYLVGTDGAHSMVRRTLGLSFAGDAFAEQYMLADVEVDWSLPRGYVVRSIHKTQGMIDDVLVCIPLPGADKRYRMSMYVPRELAMGPPAPGEVLHGLEGARRPQLRHIQATLDRLAPEPTTASTLRWSSVFRISHRIVDRYGVGRVFVAGDAAHIHPPTGAQGMNTGIQDAYNLGWKLALAVHGTGASGLLDSYHAERHPVGVQVVEQTVREAREGIGAGAHSVEEVMLREAQLLVGYPDSSLVAEDSAAPGPADALGPGSRAPDATGLRQESVGYPIRWHEQLRHPEHTLLLWATDTAQRKEAMGAARAVAHRTEDRVRCYVAMPEGADPDPAGIVLRDGSGNLAAAYGFATDGAASVAAVLIRPDGYVSYRSSAVDQTRLLKHLSRTMLVEPPR